MNWANISSFIIPNTLPTLKLPIKRHPSSGSLVFFSGIGFISNYHGCKGEAIKLIPYYMIDIIYKTIRPSRLKKLQVIQNMKNLMFQVLFIFSNRIFIKQIIVSSPSFCFGGNRLSKEYCLGGIVISFCLRLDDKKLGANCEWGGA